MTNLSSQRVPNLMNNEQKQLAVFPLPIFLLPKGRTKLRIFEPRYIRMVKESNEAGGFILSYLQKEKEFLTSDWGAWVEIIDFETLADGMLGITIEAKHLVTLTGFFYQQDRLLNANVEILEHWTGDAVAPNSLSLQNIKHAYSELLEQQTQLSEFYPEPNLTESTWIIARWLEVLPLNTEVRKKLTQKDSFRLALKTVETIILGK